jgi:hypothetical protein
MTTLAAVAQGVRIFALLSNIPPGQQTVIPRAMLEGARVPGVIHGSKQTPEFLIDFFHAKLKFHHTVRYDDKTKTWTFYRPREGELLA